MVALVVGISLAYKMGNEKAEKCQLVCDCCYCKKYYNCNMRKYFNILNKFINIGLFVIENKATKPNCLIDSIQEARIVIMDVVEL